MEEVLGAVADLSDPVRKSGLFSLETKVTNTTFSESVSFTMSSHHAVLTARNLEPTELTLTCKGMSSVNWECSDSEFEFVFEDRVCRVHSVLAEFLSAKVARVRKSDPLLSFYTFKDSGLFNAFESLVSSLRLGEPIRVEKSNFAAFLCLSQELENDELLRLLLGMIKTKSLSIEEAILLLRTGIDLGTAFSDRFGNLRDFVASRFYEIEKEILDDLDLETAQLLLLSPSLKIEDEDSLYDFVRSRSETDLSFASLFEFTYFEYLSVNRIENFASFVSENLLENITSGVWRQICHRLILRANHTRKNPRSCIGKKFVYDESKKLDGVIAYLTSEWGGNVHDKGIVNVTASSVHSDHSQPKNAVDLTTDSCFWSESKPNSWICYDFKERRVIPTSYSVMSMGGGPGWNHAKSWVIEVSNDGTENSWTIIDRRDNNNDLNDSFATVNFKISRVPSDGFRFFRLRQTGKNHLGNEVLSISSLEIFGTLSEK